MSDPGSVLDPDTTKKALDSETFKTTMGHREPPPVDHARQFVVVAYVAMAVAAPFIIGHFLIGTFAFPAFADRFAGMAEQLPLTSAMLLGLGWFAGPLLVIVDVATFWLLYRLAHRWWIGLLFVPVFIYLMMSAFIGFLLYIPLFPLISLVK